MASNPFDQFDQQPSATGDVLKSIAGGVERGAASVPMILPNLINQAFAGPQLLYRGLTGREHDDSPVWQPFYSSEDVLQSLPNALQPHTPQTPQGQAADFGGQMLGAALGAKGLQNVAQNTDALLADTSSGKPIPNKLTPDDIYQRSSQQYDNVRNLNISLNKGSSAGLVNDIESSLKSEKIIPDLSPKTYAIINDIRNAADNGTLSVNDLDQYQRMLGRVYGGEDGYLAGKVRDVIGSKISTLGSEDIASTPIPTPKDIEYANNNLDSLKMLAGNLQQSVAEKAKVASQQPSIAINDAIKPDDLQNLYALRQHLEDSILQKSNLAGKQGGFWRRQSITSAADDAKSLSYIKQQIAELESQSVPESTQLNQRPDLSSAADDAIALNNVKKQIAQESQRLSDMRQTAFQAPDLQAKSQQAGQLLSGARKDWATASALDDIQSIYDKALTTDNPVSSLKTSLRNLYFNEKKISRFTPEERELIRKAFTSSAPADFLRTLGNRLSTVISLGVGDNPTTTAMKYATNAASRGAAASLQGKRVGQLMEAIANRGMQQTPAEVSVNGAGIAPLGGLGAEMNATQQKPEANPFDQFDGQNQFDQFDQSQLFDKVLQQESGNRDLGPNGQLLQGPQTKYGRAEGAAQVLPMTQVAPGYGVTPAKDKSPEELRRVGRDYLSAMQQKYGNDALALIAYNWGPGNTDIWLKSGGDFNKLPPETQNYVKSILGG